MDVDNFKDFNDEYGHTAGDELLVALVVAWKKFLRDSDVLARFGGDEFVIVLPSTDEQHAQDMIERLRRMSPAGWSVGVTEWLQEESLYDAVTRADSVMYIDKERSKG